MVKKYTHIATKLQKYNGRQTTPYPIFSQEMTIFIDHTLYPLQHTILTLGLKETLAPITCWPKPPSFKSIFSNKNTLVSHRTLTIVCWYTLKTSSCKIPFYAIIPSISYSYATSFNTCTWHAPFHSIPRQGKTNKEPSENNIISSLHPYNAHLHNIASIPNSSQSSPRQKGFFPSSHPSISLERINFA